MIRNFNQLVWRRIRLSGVRSLLVVAGIALGLALTAGAITLDATLQASVEAQIRQTYGDTDMLVGYADTDAYLTEEDVGRITSLPEVKAIGRALIVDRDIPEAHERKIVQVGVDNSPLVLQAMRLPRELGPGEVVITTGLAEAMGVQPGQDVTITLNNGATHTWRVAALLDLPLLADRPETMAFHLDTLQSVVGLPGRITFLYVDLHDGTYKDEVAARLQALFDNKLKIDRLEMLDELRKNAGGLRPVGMALALMAVVISSLLTVSAVQVLLRGRLRDLALLRAVGATRAQVIRSILLEVALLVLTATAVGYLLGSAGAMAAARVVTRSLGLSTYAVQVPWASLVAAGLLSALLLVAVAAIPVRRISQIAPVQAAREVSYQEVRPAGKPAWAGALVLLVLTALSQWAVKVVPFQAGGMRALLGVLSGLLFVVSLFLLSWLVLRLFLRVVGPGLQRVLPETRMAVQNLLATQPRTRLTTAVVGSSVTLAVGAFVLLHTLQAEQEAALRRQFFTPIVASSWAIMDSTLPLSLAAEIEAIPGVVEAVPWGIPMGFAWVNHDQYDVDPDFLNEARDGDEVELIVVPADLAGLARLGLLRNLHADEVSGKAVITAELARRLGLQVGDVLELWDKPPGYTYQDRLVLQLGEVVDTPLSLTGSTAVLVDWSVLEFRPDHGHLWHVSIATAEDQVQTVISGLERLTEAYPELRWSTEATARKQFERDLWQRLALLWTAVGTLLLMGAVAMVNTLGANLHDRLREMAILRALGLTPLGLGRLVAIESVLYGLGALLTGLIAGVGFAYLFSRSLGVDRVAVPLTMTGAVSLVTLLCVAAVGIGFAISISRRPVTENLTAE